MPVVNPEKLIALQRAADDIRNVRRLTFLFSSVPGMCNDGTLT